jgi:hypothetical protein
MVRQLVAPREGVDLIGALPHEASQAFNRIGAANVAVHHRREGIEREEMLFVFAEAAHGFPDSASDTWRFSAARLSRASSRFSCLKIAESSMATSWYSRLGMALSTWGATGAHAKLHTARSAPG